MKLITILLLMYPFQREEMVLFDFNKGADLSNWNIVDDRVMGGRSQGNLEINKSGHALFSGDVSLEKNGGFSSLRFQFEADNLEEYTTAEITLKGDGKRYQFRVKSARGEYQSYIYYFETSGVWETVEIPLSEMAPSFRGRKLDMPNYPGQTMEELAFLIANSKAESFALEIDKIVLK